MVEPFFCYGTDYKQLVFLVICASTSSVCAQQTSTDRLSQWRSSFLLSDHCCAWKTLHVRSQVLLGFEFFPLA